MKVSGSAMATTRSSPKPGSKLQISPRAFLEQHPRSDVTAALLELEPDHQPAAGNPVVAQRVAYTRGTARGRDRSVPDGPRPSSRPRRRWPRVPGRRLARRGSARRTIRARRVWAGSRRGRSGRARAAAWSATTGTTPGHPGGRSAGLCSFFDGCDQCAGAVECFSSPVRVWSARGR